ncbi:MAG: hypothetical protein DRP46_09365 [Candidatus Zixiibacteriota bacterium]|nr:MAG: hypothetical protein DRP46_09365 [candidate division Zixibacteria bacterium]
MLRRDFIKASAITFGGIVIAREVLLSSPLVMTEQRNKKSGKTVYHLHGHARSGCASPPELQPMLENGIMSLPL